MADKIKLVQGDTRPTLVVSLTDQNTGLPISISGSTPVLKFRASGSTTVKATLTGILLPGIVLSDGTVNTNAPYNVAGSGGRCAFGWTSTALDTSGSFEGEIQVTFSDSTIQSVFDLLKFTVREEF